MSGARAVIQTGEEMTLADAVRAAVEAALGRHPEWLGLSASQWELDYLRAAQLRDEPRGLLAIDLALRPLDAPAARGEVRIKVSDLLKLVEEMQRVFTDRVEDSELARQAVAREREACAKVAEEAPEVYVGGEDSNSEMRVAIAAAIRARVQP